LGYEVNGLMANPTADWEKVGDKFYRKIQLYTAVFDQDLELENYLVTGAPYGGAIGESDIVLYCQSLYNYFVLFDYFLSCGHCPSCQDCVKSIRRSLLQMMSDDLANF
jgi:hypothetical protein